MGLFGHLVTFGLGVYTGIYMSQNYDIAPVDDPRVVIDKFIKYVEDKIKPTK